MFIEQMVNRANGHRANDHRANGIRADVVAPRTILWAYFLVSKTLVFERFILVVTLPKAH